MSDSGKVQRGGSRKGIPNKNSLTVRIAFNKMGFDLATEWAKAVMEIQDPSLRAQHLEKMAAYMYPKLKEMEITPSEILEMEHADVMQLKPADIPTETLLAQVSDKKSE